MSDKKQYVSKLGAGKVVADYLPSIPGAEANQPLEEESGLRLRLSAKKEKMHSCPIDFNPAPFEEEEEDPVTPTKSKQMESEDQELLDDDSDDSAAQELLDLEESDDEQVETKKKEQELTAIQEWAKLNGF